MFEKIIFAGRLHILRTLPWHAKNVRRIFPGRHMLADVKAIQRRKERPLEVTRMRCMDIDLLLLPPK
jgi:hypothetical protein